MRPLRDRLGEAMRIASHHPGPAIAPWAEMLDDPKGYSAEEKREHWRGEADRLLIFAPRCGVAITETP